MEKVIDLSNLIWNAMQTQDVSILEEYVHSQALFVHMGVTFNRNSELDVIKKKGIVYQSIDFQEKTLTEFENTYVLLNKLILTAVVNGNEVVNPFVVTEVYVKEKDTLKLVSMSFTKIIY